MQKSSSVYLAFVFAYPAVHLGAIQQLEDLLVKANWACYSHQHQSHDQSDFLFLLFYFLCADLVVGSGVEMKMNMGVAVFLQHHKIEHFVLRKDL